MKELEVTLRVRNNRLKERRDALGMTQQELARAAGINCNAYNALEALRCSPRLRDGSDWRETALRLANFHCVEPEELFPQAVLAIETPVAVRKIDAAEVVPLISAYQERLAEGPEAMFDHVELNAQVQRALARLPSREAEIIRLRFGFESDEEHTLDDVGNVVGVSGARVQALQERAVRKLSRYGLDDFAQCEPGQDSMTRAKNLADYLRFYLVRDIRDLEQSERQPALEKIRAILRRLRGSSYRTLARAALAKSPALHHELEACRTKALPILVTAERALSK